MMNQQKTKKAGLLKYSLIVPLALALVLSSNAETVVKKMKKVVADTAQKTTKAVADTTIKVIKRGDKVYYTAPAIKKDKSEKEKVYEVIEKMPEYPGGERKLLSYLGANIKYPEVAKKNGIQGRVIVRFVVDKLGKVGRTEVLRSVSPELDNEAIRVVNLMPVWTPGEQKGAKVAVYYTLPIQFALDGGEPSVEASSSKGLTTNSIKVTNPTIKDNGKASSTDEKVWDVIEQMPQYSGGEAAMMSFISKNLEYPVEAKNKGIQGRVILRFVVASSGKITRIEVLRGVQSALDKEAVHIVESMPNWIPGQQNGEKVNAYYTLPINFRLQ